MSGNLFSRMTLAEKGSQVLVTDAVGPQLTYADMDALSGRLAHALVGLGVGPGDRVAVQVEKSVAALALYLATLRAGAVFLPLNTAYTAHELGYFLSDAEPAVTIVDPEVVASVHPMIPQGSRIASLDKAGNGTLADLAAGMPADFLTVERGPDDLAAILYTSGTTGRSKGAMLSHHNLLSNAEVLRDCWRFTADDVLLHALPIYHAHGLFVAANVTMLSGARMHFLPGFDAARAIELMPKSTVMMGVPTFYVRLLAQDDLASAARGMRLFVSGSAPLLPETHRAWETKTGHKILERYGMTETTMLTTNPYDGKRVPGSVGVPLPGVSLRIVQPETGVDQPRGEVGMIVVKGPNVFKGYWRMPGKTAAEFLADGYFITGDLGRFDEHRYVHIVGRGKDLVITGGLNVYPREVEDAIDLLPGIVESAVIGLPHSDFGEAVTAIVVVRSGVEVVENNLIQALQDRLSRFKLPKRVLVVEELPRNTMGKVQKNLLRDRFANLYSQESPDSRQS